MSAAAVLRGARVRLRPWVDADLAPFAALNADPEVMRYMAAPLARDESDALAERIRSQLEAHGFGLWALDVPDHAGTMTFAGFVGISAKLPFPLPVAGIVPEPHEIGWRLARHAWKRGYATEAAMLALRHASEVLALPQIVSFTALANTASQAVMRRIGLARRGEFAHPRMTAGHPMRHHVLYALDAPTPGGCRALGWPRGPGRFGVPSVVAGTLCGPATPPRRRLVWHPDSPRRGAIPEPDSLQGTAPR